jgi:hypothetical protein
MVRVYLALGGQIMTEKRLVRMCELMPYFALPVLVLCRLAPARDDGLIENIVRYAGLATIIGCGFWIAMDQFFRMLSGWALVLPRDLRKDVRFRVKHSFEASVNQLYGEVVQTNFRHGVGLLIWDFVIKHAAKKRADYRLQQQIGGSAKRGEHA